ncbi:MAG: PKD domain-containing protein [Planctomycetes bacterium]|nr:PKD domain-containing protein [Planctomycetota bacterium]
MKRLFPVLAALPFILGCGGGDDPGGGNIAPTAAFSWSPTSPSIGQPVNFSDLSTPGTGTITNWSWSFAGGTPATSAVQNPSGISFATAGNHTVTLTVTDSNSLQSVKTETVVVAAGADVTDPTVTITSPTAAATYNTTNASIDIAGTASDNVDVTSVTWSNDRGGSGTCSGTESWSQTGITLLDGVNVITITAYDAAANSSTDTLTVTYTATPPDTEDPVVTIQSPTSGTTWTTSSSTLDISGIATDNVGVDNVVWSNDRGGSGACTGTDSWSATGITLYNGVNVITITAQDAVGNSGTDVLTVTYNAPDAVDPVVTIESPTTNPTMSTFSTTLNISGTASDNVAVTSVTWENDRGGNGACTGTDSWSKNGITLLVGVNVITITAFDAAGNSSTDTLTITVTVPAPPTADFTWSPASPETSQGVDFTDASTPGDGTIVTWEWTFSGGTPATSTAQNPSGITFATAGIHDVTLRVVDDNGQEDTITKQITISDPADTTKPTLDVTTVTIKGTATDNVAVTSLTDDKGAGTIADDGTADEPSETFTTNDVTMGSGAGDSSGSVTVTADDAAGNGPTNVTISITETVVP